MLSLKEAARMGAVLMTFVMAAAFSPACGTLTTCLDACDRLQECTGQQGCSCSIDRCDNEGDVADAVDDCDEISDCDGYMACLNQALATCELEQ